MGRNVVRGDPVGVVSRPLFNQTNESADYGVVSPQNTIFWSRPKSAFILPSYQTVRLHMARRDRSEV